MYIVTIYYTLLLASLLSLIFWTIIRNVFEFDFTEKVTAACKNVSLQLRSRDRK